MSDNFKDQLQKIKEQLISDLTTKRKIKPYDSEGHRETDENREASRLSTRARSRDAGVATPKESRLGLDVNTVHPELVYLYRIAYGWRATHIPVPIVLLGSPPEADSFREEYGLQLRTTYYVHQQWQRLVELRIKYPLIVRLPSHGKDSNTAREKIEEIIADRWPHCFAELPTLLGKYVSIDMVIGFEVGWAVHSINYATDKSPVKKRVHVASVPMLRLLATKAETRIKVESTEDHAVVLVTFG